MLQILPSFLNAVIFYKSNHRDRFFSFIIAIVLPSAESKKSKSNRFKRIPTILVNRRGVQKQLQKERVRKMSPRKLFARVGQGVRVNLEKECLQTRKIRGTQEIKQIRRQVS